MVVIYGLLMLTLLISNCTSMNREMVPTPPPPAVDVIDRVDEPALPKFPWPPPEPQVKEDITEYFDYREGNQLKDLNDQIRRGLKKLGYDTPGYFGIPQNGFAAVVRMERYNARDGTSATSGRWVENFSSRRFSLMDYLTALVTGKTGDYRLFVFIVADKDLSWEGTPPSDSVPFRGAPSLGAVEDSPWTKGIKVFALVYELERRLGEKPRVRDATQTCNFHLANSRILATFNP